MRKVSFIVKAHSAVDDATLVGGAAKNPYRLVRYLQSRVTVPIVIYFDGDHSGKESYRAIPVRGVMKLYAKTLYQNVASLGAVWRAFRGSDVVQCHHPHYGLGAALLRKFIFSNVKLVIKAHGTALPEFQANRYGGIRGQLLRLNARLHLWHDRFVLAQADAVICSSEFQRREMLSTYLLNSDIVRCIYNGYDPRYVVKSPARSKCSVENFTMVLCGRVVPKKGIIQGIALFQALARSNDCRLVLVLGRRSEIEDHATYARIKEAVMSDSRISVRHDLKESELYELFSESSIGIIPSENYESIPTVLIEMLAAGLPVCATYQWGIPEILPSTRGLTGNLDQDVDVLRACLGQSMGDETTRVQEEFSYTKLIDQYLALYGELAA